MRPETKKHVHHDSRKKAKAAKNKLNFSKEQIPEEILVPVQSCAREIMSPPVSQYHSAPDFSRVIANASKSDALMRLKGETEWEESSFNKNNLSSCELFSLDSDLLRRDIEGIPLQILLGIDEALLDSVTLDSLNAKAKESFFKNTLPLEIPPNDFPSASLNNQTVLDGLEDIDDLLGAMNVDDTLNKHTSNSEKNDLAKDEMFQDAVKDTQVVKMSGNGNLEEWLDELLSS